MAGHSMGGVTALRVGNSDKRVNCILVNDPWLMPIKEEIKAKKFTFRSNQSLYITNTSKFLKDTECIDTHQLLLDQLKPSSFELLQTNFCSHSHQADRCVPETLRIEWDSWFKLPRPYSYQLH